MALPVSENELGFQNLKDVEKASACKLWWKIRTNQGILATYVNAITLEKSYIYRRASLVQESMRHHTRFLIRNEEVYFLTQNWMGDGPLLDKFNLVDAKTSSAFEFEIFTQIVNGMHMPLANPCLSL